MHKHNRMRQNALGLEKKWLTKDYWFSFSTNASGLTITDTHWWHRNKKFKATPIELIRRRQNEIKIFEIECDYEIEITKFSDVLTKGLKDDLRKK